MKISKIFTLTLLVGLLVSALFAKLLADHNNEIVESAAKLQSEKLASQIQSRLERYQFGLRGVRGVIVSVGVDKIQRDIFLRYIQTRDLPVEFPGARGFGFIRRVDVAELPTFLSDARKDGAPDFKIKQLQAHTGSNYVIQYLEPLEPNKIAVGLDIASEKERREAANASMRSGVTQLTGPITLVQTSGVNQAFLLLLPIYATASTPANQKDREALLRGWAYAPPFYARSAS